MTKLVLFILCMTATLNAVQNHLFLNEVVATVSGLFLVVGLIVERWN